MNMRHAVGTFLGMMALGLAVPAQAHYVPTFSGWAYHSVQCDIILKSVPNPDSHPAVVQCEVRPTRIQVICENPAGYRFAGEGATNTVLVGSNLIDPSEYVGDKNKGRAAVSVPVDTDFLLDPQFCVNPNWTPLAVLVVEMSTVLNTYSCNKDATCAPENLTLISSVEALCTVDPQYTVENPPPVGTPYSCPNPVVTHWD